MIVCPWLGNRNVKIGHITTAGVDPGFQVRGALKIIAPSGAKIVGVFRMKNHDFTQKKTYFFQF